MWAVHQFAEHSNLHWAERKCLLSILERLGVRGQVIGEAGISRSLSL